MTRPTGINHLAIMTDDFHGQLEFFTQVLGLPLVALYDMHGAEGALHAFVELAPGSYVAFAQVPGVEEVAPELGVTHAGHGGGVSAPGTMQHVAFDVVDDDTMLGLRDRLRANGIAVFGPIDHGMCRSMYFAGPEGLTLEATTASEPIDPAQWIDPAVFERAGVSAADVERFRAPVPFERPSEPVAQPAFDPERPRMGYPDDAYRFMLTLSDDVIAESASVPDPPVQPSSIR